MLHAEPTTIGRAFPPRKQYAIPSYQRNYVWTREGQWEPLWDDLTALTRHVRAEGPRAKPHFLGAIITKQIRTQHGFLDRWWVVDGQQRLTTLQILIAATRSALHEGGLAQCASILTDTLVNPEAAVRESADKYKITHKSSDYAGFSGVIDAAVGDSAPSGDDSLPLHDCYDYFRNSVAEWIAHVPENTRHEHATALTQAILDYLQVVDIRLDGHENSHAIFEALNARGEPLTEWEKSKNYILSLAVGDDDPDGDRAYAEHLEQYDTEDYWNQRVSAPRFSGKRIDLFLFFFAQIELPKRRQEASGKPDMPTLPRARLYREFRYVGEHVYRKSNEELQGLLMRLGRYADIYKRIDQKHGDFSDYARLVMQRRATLKLASLIPVFMVLVDRLGHGADLDQALRIVDSFLMRRVALKANYSGFDDVAFGYVQAIRDAPEGGVCAALIEQLEESTWTNRWPGDDEVVVHLRDADMYNGISSARMQLLLHGIAQRMHEKNSDLSMGFTPKALTVEHVAPRSWERHWKDDLNFEDTDEDRSRLDRLVNRIGNLTLVTGRMNSRLGDHEWSWKKGRLESDNLEMNRRLIEDMEGGIWNEKEINRRSETLANYVNETWPHAAALRRTLGIPSEDEKSFVSGISVLFAKRLVDGVTNSGIEEGWADREGLNRASRGERYGRYLWLGGGDRWRETWFGVSTGDRELVLDYTARDVPDEFIKVPDGGLHEMIEYVTTQVRETAESIADGGADA